MTNDRIEELELEVETWKNRALHQNEVAGKLEAQLKKTYEALLKVTRLHDEVETKLAKVTDVALRLYYGAGVVSEDTHATLAELTGEQK